MSRNPNEAKAIFLEAVEHCPSDQWPEFLAKACGDDTDLHDRVRQLLDAHAGSESFMARPAAATAATVDMPLFAEQPGTQIGRYKLLQELGEGGMGVVYKAEQTEPVERWVALKIIKPGMDSRQVIARFEAERQALALMDHPNIAHMLDAGSTESGRPYFVMELVDGIPITEYCDRGALTVAQRLELFVLVCQAVQHAHQKGIIHRDLKPTNVLVAVQDAKPTPKVLDFGVAKAMGQGLLGETTSTRVGQTVGTPLYMSPEQAEGNARGVDTRSDIYSLGVVFYELLTGTTPFENERFRDAGLDEVRAVIRSKDPPRPSARISTLEAAKASTISARRKTDRVRLSHLLRSDLDCIVMKALEKDPERRYATARDLAEDVRRFLEGEPIHAKPPNLLDRVGKWTRRHRVAVVSVGSIAAILLVAMTVVAITQRKLVFSQRQLAARQLRLQKAISGAMMEVARLRRRADAATPNREELLVAARDQLQRALALAEAEPTDAGIQARLRQVMDELDQETRDRELLHVFDEAWLAQANTDPREGRWVPEQCIPILSTALTSRGLRVGETPPEQAAGAIRKMPESIRGPLLVALDEWSWSRKANPGTRLRRVGGQSNSESKSTGAIVRLRHSDQIVGVGRGRDDQIESRRNTLLCDMGCYLSPAPGTSVRLSVIHYGQEQAQTYEVVPDPTLAWLQAVVRTADTDPWRQRVREARDLTDKTKLQDAFEKLANEVDIERQPIRVLTKLADALQAVGSAERALELSRRIQRRFPGDVHANLNLAHVLREVKPARLEESARFYTAAIALCPSSGCNHLNLGTVLSDQGKPDEAIEQYREALRVQPDFFLAANNICTQLDKQGKPGEAIAELRKFTTVNPNNARARYALGTALMQQRNLEEAVAELREAVRLDPNQSPLRINLGAALKRQGKFDEAISQYREGLRRFPAFDFRSLICLTLIDQGRFEEAIVECRAAIQLAPDDAKAHLLLGLALDSKGKRQEAIDEYHEALRLRPNYPDVHNNLGLVLQHQGKLDEAVAEYREALRIDGNHVPAHNNLADVLANHPDSNRRKPDEALEHALKAAELAPTVSIVWGTLGEVRYRNGSWTEAIAALQKHDALGSGNGRRWLFLAMAHWQLGQVDEARKWRDKAVQWMKQKCPQDAAGAADALIHLGPNESLSLPELQRVRAEADALLGRAAPESKSPAPAPAPTAKEGATPSR